MLFRASWSCSTAEQELICGRMESGCLLKGPGGRRKDTQAGGAERPAALA